LQNEIENDASILGLGDLDVITRERRQSSGGRIDFLLHDPEAQTMYETEIQLGATDETHIIRTIEYWDIERSCLRDILQLQARVVVPQTVSRSADGQQCSSRR